MASTFGRKASAERVNPVDDIARRRAEFIAAERAREGSPLNRSQPAAAAATAVRPMATTASTGFAAPRQEKSLGVAYVLWFFLGGFSAHRFYLGYYFSGAIQVLLFLGGLLMVVSGAVGKSPGQMGFAAVMLMIGAIWVLADAFITYWMWKEANAGIRQRSTARIFD